MGDAAPGGEVAGLGLCRNPLGPYCLARKTGPCQASWRRCTTMLGDAAKPWGILTSSLLSPMPSSPGISMGRRMVEVRAPSTGDESPRSASVESRPLAESGEGVAEADVGEETVAEDSEGEVKETSLELSPRGPGLPEVLAPDPASEELELENE